jgi:Leucine-rich repeat (LRR) protein
MLDIPDKAFSALDLQELNLGYNGLRSLREEMLTGNERLKVLRMQHNSLTSFDWKTIDNLEELSELHLQDNFLSNLTGAPSNLHQLKVNYGDFFFFNVN